MSWQEELRKLDEELASGRLSADDYRVRRDQVLSSAVAHGEDPAAASQGQQQPGQQEQQPEPGQQSGGPSADSTQVISPVGNQADPGAERTQAVPPWQAQQAQQAQQPQYGQPQQPMQQGPASPAGGFQQQPGPASPAGGFQQQGPASPAGGFHQPPHQHQQQHQQQVPWNAPDADQSPPWGGTDFPPIAPPPSNEWAAQGPEGFDDKPRGGKGKIFAIVGAVVVLAGIAVGAFLIWGTGNDNNAQGNQGGQQSQQASSQPQSSQAPADPLPIADIEGQEEPHDEIKTFSDVVDKTEYLNDKEFEAYQRTDPADAKFAVFHLDNKNTVVLLLTKVDDTGAASDEVSNLTYVQTTNGARRVLDGVPDDVFLTAWEDPNSKKIQLRAHYLSGDVLVRIEVTGESGLEQIRSDFDKVLEAEQEVLPSGD